MAVIRQELDRLHDLTRELQDLQRQAAKYPAPGPVAMSDGTAVPPAPGQHRVNMSAKQPAFPPPRPGQLHPSGTPSAAPTAVRQSSAPAPGQAGSPGQPPTSAEAGKEFHLWLYERMATIQRERQSRWQTILNFLFRK
jgi:hypothetical protein